MTHNRKIYVNVPIRDVTKTRTFFEKLGFAFDEQFSNENALGMIVNAGAYVMMLAEPYFQGFTTNDICDTGERTEVLLAISCPSREAVDQMVSLAVEFGGTEAIEPQDHEFMYQRSFYDLDRHHWEVTWMDPEGMSGQ